MTPRARTIIREVAELRGVDPALIVQPCRVSKVYRARMEVAQRLAAECGYSTPAIGRILNHDHTTILFYLGRFKKKPGPERITKPRKRVWKMPRVRHLRWVKRPTRLFLVPYAGADMTDYHWKERPHQPERTSP